MPRSVKIFHMRSTVSLESISIVSRRSFSNSPTISSDFLTESIRPSTCMAISHPSWPVARCWMPASSRAYTNKVVSLMPSISSGLCAFMPSTSRSSSSSASMSRFVCFSGFGSH